MIASKPAADNPTPSSAGTKQDNNDMPAACSVCASFTSLHATARIPAQPHRLSWLAPEDLHIMTTDSRQAGETASFDPRSSATRNAPQAADTSGSSTSGERGRGGQSKATTASKMAWGNCARKEGFSSSTLQFNQLDRHWQMKASRAAGGGRGRGSATCSALLLAPSRAPFNACGSTCMC